MSLAHHGDGDGAASSYGKDVATQFRAGSWMLERLEESSEAFLLARPLASKPAADAAAVVDPLDVISEKCSALLTSPDQEAFGEELERLVRDEGQALLELVAWLDDASPGDEARSTTPEHGGRWPLVAEALAEVLGDEASERFSDGLTLLSWRGRLSRLYEAQASSVPAHSQPTVEIPDPELWGLRFQSRASDVCFAAVLALLGQHERAPQWICSLLAETFHRGQRAGVQALASFLAPICEDEVVIAAALRSAGVEVIDIQARYRKAAEVSLVVDAIMKKYGNQGVITPLGRDEGRDDGEDDYPDEDPDDWIGIGGGR